MLAARLYDYAIIKRKIHFSEHFRRLLGYWHSFHLPFAFFMYFVAIIHIAVALIFWCRFIMLLQVVCNNIQFKYYSFSIWGILCLELYCRLSFFLVVLGCGELIGSDDNADVKIGGLNAKIVSEQKFRLEGTSDNNGNSSHSFEASFHLNEDPITFYFFSNKSLEGGIQLDISRNDDSQTQFEYQLNDKKFTKVIEKLDNSKIIELGFEIHNNETDTHTLI